MNKKARFRVNFLLVSGSLFFCFFLLFLCEGLCRICTDINFQGNSRNLFAENMYGTSRGNARRVEAVSFGAEVYTDEHGFRVGQDVRTSSEDQRPAVLILGDSVGFGPALEEDKITAGLLQADLPMIKVYNSSVIGYCTYDYENVVKNFIPFHKEVKWVYLFFCLNDLSSYSAVLLDENTEITGENIEVFEKIAVSIGKTPLISKINMFLRAHSKLYILIRGIFTDPQDLFWRADYSLYSEKNKLNFSKNMQPIVDISNYLRKTNIGFTVIIMPYEYQLRSDDKNVEMPQRKLSRFFRDKGIDHIDVAPQFRNSNIASRYLYLPYDPMHFSEKGHEVLFNVIMEDIRLRKKQILSVGSYNMAGT